MNTQVHQQVKKKLSPHEDYDMPHPYRKHTISDISDLVSYPKRGNHNTPKEEATHTQTTKKTPRSLKLKTNPLQFYMTKLKHTLPQ